MKIPISVILVLVMVSSAHAANCLIYDHDDNLSLNDPLGAGWVGTQYGIVRSLENLGHTVTTVLTLPADISGYDIIFICTGWYGG